MADILIRGMEMPKSCDECRLFNESWCMALGVENWRKSYNKPPEGGRLPDCPLVPLPEGHGKIGDLDALFDKMYHLSDNEGAYKDSRVDDALILRDSACILIEDAPTIVPAEGGPDNG